MPQRSAGAVLFRRGTHGVRLLVLRTFDLLPPRLALILNWARETLGG